MLDITQIPVYQDNYIYLLHDVSDNKVAVVDPAESEPVERMLKSLGLKLDYILNTHHHPDHVGGNLALKNLFQCTIVGPKADERRIPGIDISLGDGDSFNLGSQRSFIFDVPGHTHGHIAYWFEQSHALFCGDTLFSLGCGRLFEGSPEDMWHSLCKLRELPDNTQVYCAHEYTEANGIFALTIDPNNQYLKDFMTSVREKRQRNLATIPSILGDEKRCNPFLRADVESLKHAVGKASSPAVEVFAQIRAQKDSF